MRLTLVLFWFVLLFVLAGSVTYIVLGMIGR